MPHTLKNKLILHFHGYHDDFSMGVCYQTGQHVEVDIDSALLCFSKALKAGDTRAYYPMGNLFEQKQNIDQAAKMYAQAILKAQKMNAKIDLQRLAKSGNTTAEYYFALVLEQEKNWKKSEKWYHKAATKNHEVAAYRLAELYSVDRVASDNRTIVIKKDSSTGINWYKQAAILGSKYALDALQILSATEAKAAFCFGEFYEYGRAGLNINLTSAVLFYEKAAGLGSGDADYRLGQWRESGCVNAGISQDIQKACALYVKATQRNILGAEKHLLFLANTDHMAEAQYHLGVYYSQLGQSEKAIDFFILAAEQKHEQALAHLENVKFNADFYFKMADRYENGKGVMINRVRAYEFYSKAANQGNAEAHFRCGQLHESGFTEIKQDGLLAGQSYLAGAKCRHAPSLKALQRLLEKTEIATLEFELAEFYYSTDNKNAACEYYFRAVNHRESRAILKLHELAQRDSRFAYSIAKTYEEGVLIKQNKEQAYLFYIYAMQNRHEPSRKYLLALATKGDADAQYYLGSQYYHRQQQFSEAVTWCMQAAEQHHEKALAYLTQTKFNADQYHHIARHYEFGIKVKINLAFALSFYKKACDLGHSQAAFHLAEFYQMNHDNMPRDSAQAYYYAKKAQQLKHPKATACIEKMADEINQSIVHSEGAKWVGLFSSESKRLTDQRKTTVRFTN